MQNRLSDPIEYMRELGWTDESERNPYTREKAPSLFEQIRDWGALDYEKAAQGAFDADGWQHELSRYDGKSIDLECGAVAVRE